MSVANFIAFDSEHLDDGTYSSSGDIVTPEGRGLAAAIQSALSSAGLPTSQPLQYSFYGWQMVVTDDKQAFQLLLQCPSNWLLMCEEKSSWFTKLIRGNPNLETFTNRVAEVLGHIRGIRSVLVQSQEEYTSVRRSKKNEK